MSHRKLRDLLVINTWLVHLFFYSDLLHPNQTTTDLPRVALNFIMLTVQVQRISNLTTVIRTSGNETE